MSTNKIFYLCSSPDDSGVTRACELPDGCMSFGWMYALANSASADLADVYEMEAHYRDTEETLTITLMRTQDLNKWTYACHVPSYGDVIIEIVPTERREYVGSNVELAGCITIGEVAGGDFFDTLCLNGITITGF